METPFLSLAAKDFLTGIAPSAHTELGGLFLQADGITPVYDPGGTASVENGLLQAGPAPTNIGGSTVVDTIRAAVSGVLTSSILSFFYGDEGHIYQLTSAGTLADVHDGNNDSTIDAVSNPRAGLAIWRPQGGASDSGLLYWQTTQIGLYNGTTWDDDHWTGINSTLPCPHKFLNNVYFSNTSTYSLGALIDTGASVVLDTNVLDWEKSYTATAISDDGVYLVIAIGQNFGAGGVNVFSSNKILFWDTTSSSWQRDYEIRDPFIYAMKRVGSVVYAFGQYGVYEVSFGGGVRKILSRKIGFNTPSDLASGFGTYRADVYNQEALIFGTDTTIDTLGKLSPDLPSAYYKPFLVPDSVGTPTCVFSQFAVGSVYVATDGDKLYRYDFNGTTRETGVSAKSIYLPLTTRTEITRIEVVFGEPLASEDAFSIQLKTDEDTAATPTTALSASYSTDGAIRRKSLKLNNFFTDAAISLLPSFVSGAPKIKRINLYGSPVAPN